MRNIRIHLVMIVVGLALTGTFVSVLAETAASHDEKPGLAAFLLKAPVFGFLDCEEGGAIEKAEVDEHFPQVFYHHDRNRSGDISRSEFVYSSVEGDRSKQQKIFALMDADGNGVASTGEYRVALYTMIDAADTNGDGEVTLEELQRLQSPDIEMPGHAEHNADRKSVQNSEMATARQHAEHRH